MGRRWTFAVAVVAALAWGEWQNQRWTRMLVTSRDGASEAIVVPGFRNRQAKINFINRWRARIGVRSIDAGAGKSRLIFSGGTTGEGTAEARLMADYAKSVLNFDGWALIEDQSRTTWENVVNVIPLLEDVDRIKIASQPAHALKARAYLRRQRPDLAEKLVPADCQAGDWLPLKPLLALYGLWTLRGLNADERRVSE